MNIKQGIHPELHLAWMGRCWLPSQGKAYCTLKDGTSKSLRIEVQPGEYLCCFCIVPSHEMNNRGRTSCQHHVLDTGNSVNAKRADFLLLASAPGKPMTVVIVELKSRNGDPAVQIENTAKLLFSSGAKNRPRVIGLVVSKSRYQWRKRKGKSEGVEIRSTTKSSIPLNRLIRG